MFQLLASAFDPLRTGAEAVLTLFGQFIDTKAWCLRLLRRKVCEPAHCSIAENGGGAASNLI